jgi:hypothetical protein
MSCLDAFPQSNFSSSEKVTVRLDTKDSISCCKSISHLLQRLANNAVTMTFAFSAFEGNVGEPLASQIVIKSNARPGSAPITVSSLLFQFEGGLSEVQLTHNVTNDKTNDGTSSVQVVGLEESAMQGEKPRWIGNSDLSIHPGQTKVYNFSLIFREAGDIDTTNCVFEVATEQFDLICSRNQGRTKTTESPRRLCYADQDPSQAAKDGDQTARRAQPVLHGRACHYSH